MSGKIPYAGTAAVGVHEVPKRKFAIPTCSKTGYPSRKRKKRMNMMTIIAKKAVQKKTVLMDFSFNNEGLAVLPEVPVVNRCKKFIF
jgi:hypothetical protein